MPNLARYLKPRSRAARWWVAGAVGESGTPMRGKADPIRKASPSSTSEPRGKACVHSCGATCDLEVSIPQRWGASEVPQRQASRRRSFSTRRGASELSNKTVTGKDAMSEPTLYLFDGFNSSCTPAASARRDELRRPPGELGRGARRARRPRLRRSGVDRKATGSARGALGREDADTLLERPRRRAPGARSRVAIVSSDTAQRGSGARPASKCGSSLPRRSLPSSPPGVRVRPPAVRARRPARPPRPRTRSPSSSGYVAASARAR